MTDSSCLFCRIADGSLPTEFVGQNDHAVAFRDIAPKAPVHLLVIPRRHVSSLRDADDPAELGELLALAAQVAAEAGVADSGYRVVANTGSDGGQTVGHLHLHVLGGRALGWPPG